jgi:hypothetical protein
MAESQVSTQAEVPSPASTVDDLAMYSVVAARRTQVDSTVWQVPAMSLTGQAFLLSIALASDTSRIARSLAATLAIVISVLSMQLMARLRRIEVTSAGWLEAYEQRRFGHTVHGVTVRDGLKTTKAGGLLANFRSFRIWMFGLSAFGIVGTVILVNAIFRFGLLEKP